MNRLYRLFARPGFLGGMSATLDIGATLFRFNDSSSPFEADRKALESDWLVTGNDLMFAIEQWSQEDHGEAEAE